jgi:hypothetical protein
MKTMPTAQIPFNIPKLGRIILTRNDGEIRVAVFELDATGNNVIGLSSYVISKSNLAVATADATEILRDITLELLD